MKVNREDLLQNLESVQFGLVKKGELIEQSSCYVFSGGKVHSFNDNIYCCAPSVLGDLVGAVSGDAVLNMLRTVIDDELEVTTKHGELCFKAKGHGEIPLKEEITLPIDKIEIPKKWQACHEDFCDALAVVNPIAGRDEEKIFTVCAHIHPKWIEAFDNEQLIRFRLPTGLEKSCLVRQDGVKHAVTLGVSEFSDTGSWLHLRNQAGIQIGLRKVVTERDYPDLGPYLKVRGEKLNLPKSLIDPIKTAGYFSKHNFEDTKIKVTLTEGKISIKGSGNQGRWTQSKSVEYAGPKIGFWIPPSVLLTITEKYGVCEVSNDRITVDGGRWRYVASLEVREENKRE